MSDDGWDGLDEGGADVYEVLSNARRRIIVLAVARVDGIIDLGRLAKVVAAVEEGEPVDAIDSATRKSRYTTIYQCHMDKIDESGVAEVDDRKKMIRPNERTGVEAERVAERMAHERPGALDAIDRALEQAGIAPWERDVPADIDLFRVPTGEQLRALREGAGLTQTEVAEGIGLENNTQVSRYELEERGLAARKLRLAVEYIRRHP